MIHYSTHPGEAAGIHQAVVTAAVAPESHASALVGVVEADVGAVVEGGGSDGGSGGGRRRRQNAEWRVVEMGRGCRRRAVADGSRSPA